jgi:hypothetical protein
VKLAIVERLAYFERMEEELRKCPSSPPRKESPSADDLAASEAWQTDYARRHKALTDAQESIATVVKLRMRTLAHPYGDMHRGGKVQSDADFVIAHLELIYFNSWMALRQSKRWGDSINASSLATDMVSPRRVEEVKRVLSGDEVEILVRGEWRVAAVVESGGEARGDFWFVVTAPPEVESLTLGGRSEGDLWRRRKKP